MSLLRREDSLSIVDKKCIDRICLAFEDAWLSGQRPVVETYLRQAQPVAQPALLDELLLLDLDYRRSLNDTPSLEDYLRRFPQLAHVVRGAFDKALVRDVPKRFLPGSLIGRYRVRKMLGAGAFASVYLAWDEQLERHVAVKVPHPSRLGDARARQRFVEEARAIAGVRHPRIVAVYDAGELDEGVVYLVMQYVEGPSLRQLLEQGELRPEQACSIAADVAEAVDTAHRSGIFHRDLKPGNILIDKQGYPHVCDFGLALRESQQRERQGEYAGTLAYMAPEQLRGEAHQLDGRADIWAVGVILYEMLTGRQPFQGRDGEELLAEIMQRDPRPPRQIGARISKRSERVCLRCLAKRPADRYATAGDVAEELRCQDRRRRYAVPLALVIAAVSLLSVWAAARWMRSPADSANAESALRGSIELLVWTPDQPQRQGARLSETHTVPLRAGDRVRLVVELNQAAYIYVVWLDTECVLAPVYPWTHGKWTDRPASERPRARLAIPEQTDNGWMMEVAHDGMETLLLLVRRSPLPEEVALPELLAALPATRLPRRPHAAWFQTQDPPGSEEVHVGARPGRKRDPKLDREVAIDDPLLKLHRRLAETLQPHFDLIQAVTFPVQGD